MGTLRSLGEGGCASEGFALGSVWRGATAVRPWGSTEAQATEKKELFHRRDAEHAEFVVFFNQNLFTLRPLRLGGAISEPCFTRKPEVPLFLAGPR